MGARTSFTGRTLALWLVAGLLAVVLAWWDLSTDDSPHSGSAASEDRAGPHGGSGTADAGTSTVGVEIVE
jgi:hypothetical protein